MFKTDMKCSIYQNLQWKLSDSRGVAKGGLTKVGREWSGNRSRWQEKSLEAPFPGLRWFFALVFMFQTILEPEQAIIKIFETVKCKYHVYASLTFQLPMEHHLVIFVPLPHHCWLPTISKRQQRFTPHLQSAQSWWLNLYQVWISFFLLLRSARGGGIRIYGIEVILKRYFGNLYFNVRYWGTSSPSVCGFLSFWVMVLIKRRSSTLMRYRPFELSCLIQVKTIYNTKYGKLNRLMRVNFLSL